MIQPSFLSLWVKPTWQDAAGEPLFSAQSEEEDVLTLGSAEGFASSILAIATGNGKILSGVFVIRYGVK